MKSRGDNFVQMSDYVIFAFEMLLISEIKMFHSPHLLKPCNKRKTRANGENYLALKYSLSPLVRVFQITEHCRL
jgi:hypothetical protein